MTEQTQPKTVVCPCCSMDLQDSFKYCPGCGYPLTKTEAPDEKPVSVGSALDDSLPPEVQEIRRKIRLNNARNGNGKPPEGETRSAQEIVAAIRAKFAEAKAGQPSAGPRPDEANANPPEKLADWQKEGAAFRTWQADARKGVLCLVPPSSDIAKEEQPAADEQTETLNGQMDLDYDSVSDVAEKSGWSEKKFIATILALVIVLGALGFLGMILYKVFIAG